MKNGFLMILTVLFSAVNLSAQTTNTDYEALKEAMIKRMVISYLNIFQGEEDLIEQRILQHSIDGMEINNLDALKQAAAQIPADYKILERMPGTEPKFEPGSVYRVMITTKETGKMGMLILEVVGDANAPGLKVSGQLRIAEVHFFQH